MSPFYVERTVGEDAHVEWLKVDDWYYQSWVGCFCLVQDKQLWVTS